MNELASVARYIWNASTDWLSALHFYPPAIGYPVILFFFSASLLAADSSDSFVFALF
jgi:hypothetical protein